MSNDNTQADSLIEVQQEQVTRLYEKTGLSFWGNIIIAIVLAGLLSLQYGNINQFHLFIWFGLIFITSIYRLVIADNFQKEHNLNSEKIDYWITKYIQVSTMINVIWGSISIFLFPDSTLHQGLLILCLISILIASVPLLAISKNVYYLQMAIILLPVTAYLLWIGSMDHNLMTVALATATVSLIAASHYIYDLLFQLQQTQTEFLRQANTDQLTKMPNRRHYDQAFKTEWRRCTREHLPISMLLIDVDYFKKYNDKLGHVEGDKCLKNIASRLGNISRRPGDVAARYGGEEFSVLLPNTSEENAMMLAERFRVSIERLAIPHPDSEYDVVTVSIGVSSCDSSQHESNDVIYPAMLMNSADNAMYLAKRQGRNRIATQGCGEQKIADALREEALKDANKSKPEKVFREAESPTEPA